ncbi:prolipoprotein diacylglyceryl transferase [Candidatus Woesearchaeota archaeon CG10_big_fil_rev_8_21_14_0_10_36_11]|nr:MAG: prolipoprotein diacylglyceryl transferase [Candidatus Woesearchaeota archaeon CG10_big_fil_rev_8_21_14_0_10_36_11]
MYINNLNPVLLNLGPLEIRWYGIVYVLGFFMSLWWMLYLQKKGKPDIHKEQIWDFVFYCMVGVLVGARVFMIFWQPEMYLLKPWNLLKIWEGGMSFHGGFVGIVVAGWWYCKKNKLNFWTMADILSVPAIFVLALGRIANFVNGELIGRVWPGKWCVVFPQYDSLCRHPSTLYAAAKRFVVFGWLVLLTFRQEFKPGFIFWNFVFFEGLGRFIVDFYREDILYVGLSLGQWFSAIMIIVSLVIFMKYYRNEWRKIQKT